MARALSDLAPPPADPVPEIHIPDDTGDLGLLRPERRSLARRIAEVVFVPASLLLLAWALAVTFMSDEPPQPDDELSGAQPAAAAADAESQPAPRQDVEAAAPAATAAPAAPAAPPPVSPPEPAFPVEPARGFAARFTLDYLTWDQARPDLREAALRAYLPTGHIDPQLGWEGAGVQVAATPIVAAIDIRDAAHAVLTVAARVTGQDAPRWLHLQVDVAADESGRLAVVGRPRLVAPPTPAQLAEPSLVAVDAEASLAAEPAAVQALTDLAASGLGGAVALDQLVELAVERRASVLRPAIATVRWRDAVTGSTFLQSYPLHVAPVGDGTWTVTFNTA